MEPTPAEQQQTEEEGLTRRDKIKQELIKKQQLAQRKAQKAKKKR
jgi:hypothetical protein